MDDFTLIIPTYNRPVELGHLLAYLSASACRFPVAVLDSSAPAAADRNRDAVTRSGLNIRYSRHDESTDPFAKFAHGAAAVETTYAALCPDDDIPILSGLEAALRQLRQDPSCGLAHGWSFLFRDDAEAGRLELSSFIYRHADLGAEDPLRRVHNLVRRYQAPTYGVYRTALLYECLDRARHQDSLLWREHLASAIAVARSRVGQVDAFAMGRRAGRHAARRHWHPVEWMIGDPLGLAAGFASFAAELTAILSEGAACGRGYEQIRDLVHLIYADYFAQQVPQELFDHVIDARLRGEPPERIFVSPQVTGPVIAASQRYNVQRYHSGATPSADRHEELLLRSPVREYHCRWELVLGLGHLDRADRDSCLRDLADVLDRWHLAAARWDAQAVGR